MGIYCDLFNNDERSNNKYVIFHMKNYDIVLNKETRLF